MKIVASDLRMDALTEHREVHGEIYRMGTSARFTQEGLPAFRLVLPQMTATAGGYEAHSQISSTEAWSSAEVGKDDSSAFSLKSPAEVAFTRKNLGEKGRGYEEEKGRRVQGENSLLDYGTQTSGAVSSRSVPVSLFGRMSFDYSYERIATTASGGVRTTDGRDIDFSLSINVEREDITIRADMWSSPGGMFIDPLVLNLDAGVDSLGENVFSFDLDGDGVTENISGLRGDSGFLGLDFNGDGRFNDGSELFGPRTGFAFDELREYDEDGNAWLDENDPVFARLGLWLGAGGEDARLVSLKEAGIGALALASTANQYSLKNNAGQTVGRIDRSGLFLLEDGTVRSLQEIDLQAIDENDGAEDASRPVETISQAFGALQRLIAVRRRQLEHLTMLRIVGQGHSEKEKSLAERFWEWQEKELQAGKII